MTVISGDTELEIITENMMERETNCLHSAVSVACVFDVDTCIFQVSPAGVNRLITASLSSSSRKNRFQAEVKMRPVCPSDVLLKLIPQIRF